MPEVHLSGLSEFASLWDTGRPGCCRARHASQPGGGYSGPAPPGRRPPDLTRPDLPVPTEPELGPAGAGRHMSRRHGTSRGGPGITVTARRPPLPSPLHQAAAAVTSGDLNDRMGSEPAGPTRAAAGAGRRGAGWPRAGRRRPAENWGRLGPSTGDV